MNKKHQLIKGFSKQSKAAKLEWIADTYTQDSDATVADMKGFWHSDEKLQNVLDGFSENTISNYMMPYGIAPNFIINDKVYAVPMVIEESSVVAAAASAAKYWSDKGGFKAEILGTKKVGQVHFSWKGDSEKLKAHFDNIKTVLRHDTQPITQNMQKRGGGILDIELLDFTDVEADYYQLRATFETCDSMGANFINSVLEAFGESLKIYVIETEDFQNEEEELTIIMAILSNYTPECVVRASVECPIEAFNIDGKDNSAFAKKFEKAVKIARLDPYRATTHNKGIFNGIDAVVLATANDFRAIEACGHAYAARDGQYRSLSQCEIKDGVFKFWLDIPLAVGTVGGLTSLHPLAKRTLEILGNPSAEELMQVIAVVGLAQNFAALRSLVTTGIQKGHMKMHLQNILNHLEANEMEAKQTLTYFEDKTISFTAVRTYVNSLRETLV
ncbi:MAG: hydroxymethylglutaryl-CoA reductase, degradative [Saprospiraceae bacterium]|nr:hydroxymethylglutaryl-CoA reductase, degradative [Saprospiraceae bacterium]